MSMLKNISLVLFLLFGFANSAGAGTSGGLVVKIYVHVQDIVIFQAGVHEGKPSCSRIGDEWAFSLTTPTGKAMYALLLMANAQGKTISVQGTGACTAWADRETPLYIVLSN